MAKELKFVTWGEIAKFAEGYENCDADFLLPFRVTVDGEIYDRILFVKIDDKPSPVLARLENDEYVYLLHSNETMK